jgi:RNA polymerase sigma-70 factor, ECF subfamily
MDAADRFRAVFGATYGPVLQYLHRRGVDYGRAEDLVAETFVVVWRRLDEVPADDPLPWLLAVARNLWLNERRANRRRHALQLRLPPPPAAPPPEEPSDRAALRQALAALDPADRELLLLVAWDGLSAAQAGASLGCRAGAARVRLHRARVRLAQELVKHGWTSGQDPDESQFTREVSDDRHA